MSVEAVLRILYPGVQGLLSASQASNLILSLILLAIDPVDATTLRFLARFFTPSDYDELVQERSIISQCGYPVCANTLKTAVGSPRRPSALAAFPWSNSYCSRHCYLASQFYRKQLSDEVLVTRRDVAYKPYGEMHYESHILLLDEVEHYAHVNHVTVIEAIREMMAHDLDREMEQLTIELQDDQMDVPVREKLHPVSAAGAASAGASPTASSADSAAATPSAAPSTSTVS